MNDKTFSQTELDAAVTAAKTEASTAAMTAGIAQGATAERARFKEVQAHEHYKGRETSANHILHTTDMKADAVVAVLSGLTAAPSDNVPPKQELPADRAQNAQGGLAVVDGAQGDQPGGKPAPANDFEKGKAVAAGLPAGLKK